MLYLGLGGCGLVLPLLRPRSSEHRLVQPQLLAGGLEHVHLVSFRHKKAVHLAIHGGGDGDNQPAKFYFEPCVSKTSVQYKLGQKRPLSLQVMSHPPCPPVPLPVSTKHRPNFGCVVASAQLKLQVLRR